MIQVRASRVHPRPVERNLTGLSAGWKGHIPIAAVMALAAGLNLIGLDREGYGNTYYAAAVRSMMQNWHAFFFNSLDPTGFVSLDKPPLGFWLQVVSVKVLGYNGVSLMLPQALAGILSVGLLYVLVSRIFGRPSGIIAALVLTLTPINVVANRNNIVDSTLVLAVLAGAWAVSRAVETGRLRWLLLCAIFVGLGFNIKMLQAFLVVPAFGLMYLVGSHGPWRRRLLHLGAAAIILLSISLAWVTAVDLTPAGQRPWVGSTTTNSALDLALGYNGLQRLTGTGAPGNRRGRSGGFLHITGANPRAGFTTVPAPTTGPSNGGPPGGALGGPGGIGENGASGPLRLLNVQLGSQIGWLLPLAIIGLLVAAWTARRHSPLISLQQSSMIMWGTWLVTTAGFFSVAGFFHTYYLVMIAPAIAALCGIGILALWQVYRRPGNWLWLLLPVSLAAVAVLQVHLLGAYPSWSRWLAPLIATSCILAAGMLIAIRLRPLLATHLVLPAVSAGVVALLAAPATWSVTSVQASNSGFIPRAGPVGTGVSDPFALRGRGLPPLGAGAPNGPFPAPGSGPSGGAPLSAPGGQPFAPPSGMFPSGMGGPGGNRVDQKLLAYLQRQQGKATYLFATTDAGTAESYMIATGTAVMATGGFLGSDPILTPTKLATLVKKETVRFFLLGGFGGPGGSSVVPNWVQQHCGLVPNTAYGATVSGSTENRVDRVGVQQLYDCRATG